MNDYPFKEAPDTPVSVCSHIMNDASLHWVYHLPEEQYTWYLICSEDHEESDMLQITLAEAAKLFPEINELADIPQDMKVMFKRGQNSGKWYDFLPS